MSRFATRFFFFFYCRWRKYQMNSLMLIWPYWKKYLSLCHWMKGFFLKSTPVFILSNLPLTQTPNHSLTDPPSICLFFVIKDIPSEHGGQSPNQNDCGTWVRNINGGVFTSPNYPNTYPPNKECVYILEGTAVTPPPALTSILSSRQLTQFSHPSAHGLPQWMSLVWLTLFYITSSDFAVPLLAGSHPDIFRMSHPEFVSPHRYNPFERDGKWCILGRPWLLA